MPTFTENVKEALSELVYFIVQVYNGENTKAKVILSFLFGMIFVLFSAICFFTCCSSDEPVKRKRTSVKTRDSTGSERSSLVNDKSRNSTSGTENESVKKRSTARRRE